MGVSFKVSKHGTRYRPKQLQIDAKDDVVEEKPKKTLMDKDKDDNDEENDPKQCSEKGDFTGVKDIITDPIDSLGNFGLQQLAHDHEVSFSLNLFPDGFFVGKATEEKLTAFHDVPKYLNPYDRASDKLFSAIEYGCLPGDAFDDIPCKYVNGALLCELPQLDLVGIGQYWGKLYWSVGSPLKTMFQRTHCAFKIRDYRNCMRQQGVTISSGENCPVIHKLPLKMCMENVIKDIPSISGDSWSYNDLLEVESRILKALQPELQLKPVPLLDRFYETRLRKKLNLGISRGWRKGKQSSAPEANLISKYLFRGNHIFGNGVSKRFHAPVVRDRQVPFTQQVMSSCFSNSQHTNAPETLEQSFPMEAQTKHLVEINGDKLVSTAKVTPSYGYTYQQDLSQSSSRPRNSGTLLLGKRGRSGPRSIPGPNIKKLKQERLDFAQQRYERPHSDPMNGPDLQVKRTQFEQDFEAEEARAAQMFMNNDSQTTLDRIPKLPVVMPSYQDCDREQHVVAKQPLKSSQSYKLDVGEIKDEHHTTDLRKQSTNRQPEQLIPLSGANVPTPVPWNSMGQPVCDNLKTKGVARKRRSSLSPQVSAGRMLPSPASSKSELSCLPMGVPHSTCASGSFRVHKKKATSMPIVGDGTASLSSIKSDYMLMEASLLARGKSDSPKTSTMNGVGSYSSNSNMKTVNAKSPLVGIPSLSVPSGTKDDPVLERFLKIDQVVKRHALYCKKQKFDQLLQRKPLSHIPPLPAVNLLDFEDTEILKDATTDKMSLSQCLLCRNLNISTNRTLTFLRRVGTYQGNGTSVLCCSTRVRLVMVDKPKDGTVEACVLRDYEEEIGTIKSQHCLLPVFPNACYADSFAAQFTSVMVREGYQLIDDRIKPTSPCCNGAYSNKKPCVITSAVPGSEAAELHSPIKILDQSMRSPSGSGISALTFQQLASYDIPTESCLLPPGQIQSALQHSARYLSKSQQMGIAANLASMQQQQQQQHLQIQRPSHLVGNCLNPLSNLHVGNQRTNYLNHLKIHLQQQQRLRQQYPLIQRKMMVGVGGLGPAISMGGMGMMQASTGEQVPGSLVGPGNMDDTIIMGDASSTAGEHVPLLGNASQNNNLRGYFSSSANISGQLISSPLPAPPPAVLSKLRVAQSQGRAMLNGASSQGNLVDGSGAIAGNCLMQNSSMLSQGTSRTSLAKLQNDDMLRLHSPMASNVAFNSNQPLLQQHIQKQQQQLLLLLQQQQQHDRMQLSIATSLAEQVSSPPSHVSPFQFSHHTQMSPEQLSSGSVPQQVNTGNLAAGSGSHR